MSKFPILVIPSIANPPLKSGEKLFTKDVQNLSKLVKSDSIISTYFITVDLKKMTSLPMTYYTPTTKSSTSSLIFTEPSTTESIVSRIGYI